MSCGPDKRLMDGSCCKKCSKGTHVATPCDKHQDPCQQCSDNFYTEQDNFLSGCLPCKSCESVPRRKVLTPCKSDRNTVCECINGFFCKANNGDDCHECIQVKTCPPGYQASVPPNRTHDTVCQPCPPGTFNNKTDYVSLCQNHTSCSALGRYQESGGTAETDAVCGDFVSRCHWMIPASLWAGLILSILLIIIGALCWRSKHRRKAVITLVSSENFTTPVLPPDVIKHPRSPGIETLTYNCKPCATEDDGGLECDGVSVDMFSEKSGAFPILDSCTSFISDPYRSEPQEDDWPGL